jgi:beta-lactamase class A
MIIASDNNMCDVLLWLLGKVDAVNRFINSHHFMIKNNEETLNKIWKNQFLNTTTTAFSVQLLRQFYAQQRLSKKSTHFLYKSTITTTAGQQWMKSKLRQVLSSHTEQEPHLRAILVLPVQLII